MKVSGREMEVLAAVAAGRSNAQIANRLHISVRTVEGHVSSLLRKYGVTDRTELAGLPVAPQPDEVAGLPGWRTTFVGRSVEQETVTTALASGRLVTLVGPGGVGKTTPGLAWFTDYVPCPRTSPPRIAIHTGDTRDARALVDHIGQLTTGKYLPYARGCVAELAVVAGLPDAADVLAAAQPVGDKHAWAAAYLMRAAGRLHGDTGLLSESAELWERLGARAEWTFTRQLLNGVVS